MQNERVDEYDGFEEPAGYEGDPGDEQPVAQEEKPALSYSQEQVEALIADRLEAQRRLLIDESVPKPSKPVQETAEDPYDRAVREATAADRQFDTEYVTRLATKYVREEADKKVANLKNELINEIGTHFGPILQERVAKETVGDNAVAQDIAIKLLRKGVDITDPDIKDVIRRGAESIAAEKAPKRGDYERYNTQTQRFSNAEAKELDEIEAIIKSVNPKASVKK